MGLIMYKSTISSNSFQSFTSPPLNQIIENFWEIESYRTKHKETSSTFSKKEQKAIQTLERTVSFENKHYSVGLLWKNNQPSLINNQNLACRHLYSSERGLKRNPYLTAKYKQKINEFINKGHVKKLTEKESNSLTSIINYIPHHEVTNVNKPGKVRVIYDTAAEFNNTYLNKNLLKGPDLLSKLIGNLLHIHRGRYTVIADIEQIFHQIYIHSKD